jgi:hypothetical protein
MFASTNMAGDCVGTPDTCLTPSQNGSDPIVYTNTGMLTAANTGTCSSKIKILNKNACTQMSQVNNSSGDEAGTSGGVTSGTFMQTVGFTAGSSAVMMDGQAATYQCCTTKHNGSSANCPSGTQASPSQTMVLVRP